MPPPPAAPLVSASFPAVAACPAAPALRVDPRLAAALAAVFVIWGSTYFAMHEVVRYFPPLAMAGVRYVAAGVLLLAIARARGAAWPTARQWLASAPIGALLFVGGNGFVAIAVTTLDSSIAAVASATMPLWVAALAALLGERPRRREWLGLVVGFTGVVVLIGDVSVGGDPVHLALLVVSPAAFAAGSLLQRRLAARGATAPGLPGAAAPMATGGAALLLGALLRGEAWPASAPAGAWLALGYLVVFGSMIAFSAFTWLLAHARPAVATSHAYVNPAIAVGVGAALGGEALGPTTLVATALIVAAVALAMSARSRS